jgi:class 3 adenylate cyclase
LFSEEYPEVSCLNSDIYQFNLINSKLEANEIVTLINQVFYLFDKLVESHQCCKIYTLADNFFVVAGAPICQPDHAERLLNLGFGFINSVRTLVIPRIQLPLLMRVSIHSGPMVGCVVGTSRRRFYVLSETVNIAKRLTNFSEAGRILITGATKV